MEIKKVIKKSKNLEVVRTNLIYGGEYAFINWNEPAKNIKTGLTLDAAINLFEIVKGLENH